MKKHLPAIIMGIIFLCGLSLFLYPTISNLYNEYCNNKLIGDYQEYFEEFTPEQSDAEMKKAHQFEKFRHDPDQLQELGLTYESVLNPGGDGMMGFIEIPKISASLVIFHSIDEQVLQEGIGHVESSSLPIGGESTHCVLAGHTGLPSAKLLTNMDQLKRGDPFYIHVLDEVLEYRIDQIIVVEPHEVDRLNVETGKDYVTLVTCTPYGVNSHRLLVRGTRVLQGGHLQNGQIPLQNNIVEVDMIYLITFSLIGLLILIISIRMLYRFFKNKHAEASDMPIEEAETAPAEESDSSAPELSDELIKKINEVITENQESGK